MSSCDSLLSRRRRSSASDLVGDSPDAAVAGATLSVAGAAAADISSVCDPGSACATDPLAGGEATGEPLRGAGAGEVGCASAAVWLAVTPHAAACVSLARVGLKRLGKVSSVTQLRTYHVSFQCATSEISIQLSLQCLSVKQTLNCASPVLMRIGIHKTGLKPWESWLPFT